MDSSSGTTSSGSSLIQNSTSSEEDLQQLMDQRKRKRMISNRESARRSRMRKQKHLDDLAAQLGRLRRENSQIISTINVTAQQYLGIEEENSILRSEIAKLSHRLQSLDEIMIFLNVDNGGFGSDHQIADGFLDYHWNNSVFMTQQPLMPFADVLQY